MKHCLNVLRKSLYSTYKELKQKYIEEDQDYKSVSLFYLQGIETSLVRKLLRSGMGSLFYLQGIETPFDNPYKNFF